jgi:plasmid stability protein
MATLTLNLSDELQKLAEMRAAATGYASVADYLASLIEGEAAGAPERLAMDSNEQVESVLLSRLQGSSVPMNADDFRGMREKLTAQIQREPQPWVRFFGLKCHISCPH